MINNNNKANNKANMEIDRCSTPTPPIPITNNNNHNTSTPPNRPRKQTQFSPPASRISHRGSFSSNSSTSTTSTATAMNIKHGFNSPSNSSTKPIQQNGCIFNSIKNSGSNSGSYAGGNNSGNPSPRSTTIDRGISVKIPNSNPSSNVSTPFKASNNPTSTNMNFTSVNPKVPLQLAEILSSLEIENFPGLRESGRYLLTKNIQQSLFGTVKVGYDSFSGKNVCIKISFKQYSNVGHSVCGPVVMEDVRNEADILRFLTSTMEPRTSSNYNTPIARSATASPFQFNISSSTTSTSRRISQSMSSSNEPIHSSSNSSFSTPNNSTSNNSHNNVDPNSLDYHATQGSSNISLFVDELEDEAFHYLITEFCDNDMFSVLSDIEKRLNNNSNPTSQIPGRLNEETARVYFTQLVQAVAFLHSNHIIHLDLSIENICLTENGNKIKLIDFGLATMHPMSMNQLHLKYHEESKLLPRVEFLEISNTKNTNVPIQQDTTSFPLKPVLSAEQQLQLQGKDKPDGPLIAKPGKLGYMSAELYSCNVWDGYSNDCYSLGVVLYLLLTGRPAYTRPSLSDVWFNCIYTGQWKREEIRSQPIAQQVYAHLSDDAIDLIDKIIKPQEKRLNLKQILDHPWMKKGNATSSNVSRDLNAAFNSASLYGKKTNNSSSSKPSNVRISNSNVNRVNNQEMTDCSSSDNNSPCSCCSCGAMLEVDCSCESCDCSVNDSPQSNNSIMNSINTPKASPMKISHRNNNNNNNNNNNMDTRE